MEYEPHGNGRERHRAANHERDGAAHRHHRRVSVRVGNSVSVRTA
jgi:hypothetical protein